MEKNSISTKVDFKDILSAAEIQDYIHALEGLANNVSGDAGKGLQKMLLPVSSEQPEDAPIAVFQKKQSFSIILTGRSVVYQKELPSEVSVASAADGILSQLEVILGKDKIVDEEKVGGITLAAALFKSVKTVADMRQLLSETEYRDIADTINDNGFSLGYFKPALVEAASGQSVTYSSIADLKNGVGGVLVSTVLLLGGIDIVKAKRRDVNGKMVEKFVAEVKDDGLKDVLEEVYGKQWTK